MRAIAPALCLTAALLFAQQSKPADAFLAQRQKLRAAARGAYDREMARANGEACKNAATTRDIISCRNEEEQATQANLDAYTASLRSLFKLRDAGEGAAASVPGPTGVPLTGVEELRQFDAAEAAWQDYSKALSDAAFGLYKGGTIAPVMEITCQQALLHGHLRDLETLYGDYFSH